MIYDETQTDHNLADRWNKWNKIHCVWAGYYLAFLIFADHFSSQVIDFCMHMAKNQLIISVMILDQLLNLPKMLGNNDQFIPV